MGGGGWFADDVFFFFFFGGGERGRGEGGGMAAINGCVAVVLSNVPVLLPSVCLLSWLLTFCSMSF